MPKEHFRKLSLFHIKTKNTQDSIVNIKHNEINRKCHNLLGDTTDKNYHGCAYLPSFNYFKGCSSDFNRPNAKVYLSDKWKDLDYDNVTYHENDHLTIRAVGQLIACDILDRKNSGVPHIDDWSATIYHARINHINNTLDKYEQAEEDSTGALHLKRIYNTNAELQKILDDYNRETRALEGK